MPESAILEKSSRLPLPGARIVARAERNIVIVVSLHLRRSPGGTPLPDQAFWASQPIGRRRYSSHSELGARHGAAAADLDAVKRFARSARLKVIKADAAKRLVVLSGTITHIERAFEVELVDYEVSGRKYRGHDGPIHIPQNLAGIVEGAFGFDNRQAARPQTIADDQRTQAPPTPVDIARRYNFPKPPAAIASQTIALLEFSDPSETHVGAGGFWASDIQSYFGTAQGVGPDFPIPPITAITVAGPGNIPQSGGLVPDGEVALDIEVAGAAAPGVNIHVYFTT